MALKAEPNDMQPKTAFQKRTCSTYGTITSIDVTPKFLKEYLQASLVLSMGYPSCGDSEIDKRNVEIWENKVAPFFRHMDEILDTL